MGLSVYFFFIDFNIQPQLCPLNRKVWKHSYFPNLFFHLSSQSEKIYSSLPEIINIQYYFMNKMHNLQKWQLHQVLYSTVWLYAFKSFITEFFCSIVYSHYCYQFYCSIQLNSFRWQTPPHSSLKCQVFIVLWVCYSSICSQGVTFAPLESNKVPRCLCHGWQLIPHILRHESFRLVLSSPCR